MREPVLKAVAMPPRLFWAPAIPALLNMCVQFPFMMIWIATNHNPMYFIGTIFIAHFAIVAYSVNEPHLSNMVRAWGPSTKARKNIYKSKGTKLSS